jgi:hypothetical protein
MKISQRKLHEAAQNKLQYQTLILRAKEVKWQEIWDAAVNPFEAVAEYMRRSPGRQVAYEPFFEAQRELALTAKPKKG